MGDLERERERKREREKERERERGDRRSQREQFFIYVCLLLDLVVTDVCLFYFNALFSLLTLVCFALFDVSFVLVAIDICLFYFDVLFVLVMATDVGLFGLVYFDVRLGVCAAICHGDADSLFKRHRVE